MALDFPINPSPGQEFQNWIWDGAKWGPLPAPPPSLPLSGGTLTSPGNLVVTGSLTVPNPAGSLQVSGTIVGNGSVITNNAFEFHNTTVDTTHGFYWTADNNIANLFATAAGFVPLQISAQTVAVFVPTLISRNSSLVGGQSPPNNTVLDIVGADGTGHILLLDAYASNPGQSAQFLGRRARGTAAAPLPVQSGDTLLSMQGAGRGSTLYPSGPQVQMLAAENWSDAACGSAIRLRTASDGANQLLSRIQVQNGVLIGTYAGFDADPGVGALKLIAAIDPPTLIPPNTGVQLQLVQVDNAACVIELNSFTGANVIIGRASGGSLIVPGDTPNNTPLMMLQGRGWSPAGWSTQRVMLNMVSIENWTDTAQGTAIQYMTTSVGTVNTIQRMLITQGVTIGNFFEDIPHGALRINASNSPLLDAVYAGTMLHINGGDGFPPQIVFDGYGGPPTFNYRYNRGTPTAPLEPLNADYLALETFYGLADGNVQQLAGFIIVQATQDWIATANGVRYGININPRGTNTQIAVATFDPDLGCQLLGTRTNDSAPSYIVGEYITAEVAALANFPASGTVANAIAMTLTPGDWDIGGMMFALPGGATVDFFVGSVSLTSASNPGGFWQASGVPVNTTQGVNLTLPEVRATLISPTNVYIIVQAQYTGGPPQYQCKLWARRRR